MVLLMKALWSLIDLNEDLLLCDIYSSLSLAMIYIVYTVNNRVLVVFINAKILILTYVMCINIFQGNYGIHNSAYGIFFKVVLYDTFLKKYVLDYCVT